MNFRLGCFVLLMCLLMPFLFAVRATADTIAPGMAASTPAAGGTTWALLVAVDAYDSEDITPLKYCAADAQGVAKALMECEGLPADHVFLMTGDERGEARATNVNVFKRLDVLAKKVQPGDTFIFFFAGHGFAREGKYYLATVNADASDVETLMLSAIPLEMLKAKLAKIAARQTVFFLDACRNDPDKGRGGEGDNLRTAGLSIALKEAAGATGGGQGGAALLFACGEGERAYDWPEQAHGVFSYYLEQGLRGAAAEPGGLLTVTGLADYVQRQVTAWSEERNKRQRPELLQQGAAKIVLADDVLTPESLGGKVNPLDINAYLQVTTPAGATVQLTVDGTTQEKVSPCIFTVPLGVALTKPARVQVAMAGCEPLEQAITMTRGATSRLALTLRPAATTARLEVTSDPPGATVLVGGQPAAKTPCTFTIELGEALTKTVEVGVTQQGYKDVVNQVTLERGKLTPVQVTLDKIAEDEPDLNAYLEVTTTPPGATVEVDKQQKTTPCRFTFPLGVLQTKDVEVKVSKDWYEDESQTVNIERGKTKPVDLMLREKDIALLRVTSVPPGVQVLLGGQQQEETTPCTLTVDLGDEREKTVELGLTVGVGGAYADKIRNIPLTRGKMTPVTVTLQRAVPAPPNPTDQEKIGQESMNPVDGATMVWVPAGDFLMGNTDEEVNQHKNRMGKDAFVPSADAEPQHSVYLDGFWMYKNDVTVEEYAKFCEVTGHKMPRDYVSRKLAPITEITWYDAQAYANWAGVTLPTEAQWEKAARGIDGRIFPWGNEWDWNKCRCSHLNWTDGPSDIGSYPVGVSPYGVMDMAGNVAQWCADWYAADYYKNSPAKNPNGPLFGTTRVIRGCNWCQFDNDNLDCSWQFSTCIRSYNDPSEVPYAFYGDGNFGFRCASLSLEP